MKWNCTVILILVLLVASGCAPGTSPTVTETTAPAPTVSPTLTPTVAPTPTPTPTPVPTPSTPVQSPTPADKENDAADSGLTSITYKVEFVAEWSEKTHPGNYPGSAHFSPFVAYSHKDSADALIFSKGLTPSPGIEQMAETGGTSKLIQEIDELIKLELVFKQTRGGVFDSPGIDTAELELTEDYSLVTFVSMLAPSPDWFVAQTTDLMQGKEWIDKIELELITYDAGSDSGETLSAQNIDTSPKEPVTVFSDYLQSLGKLVLTRIK